MSRRMHMNAHQPPKNDKNHQTEQPISLTPKPPQGRLLKHLSMVVVPAKKTKCYGTYAWIVTGP